MKPAVEKLVGKTNFWQSKFVGKTWAREGEEGKGKIGKYEKVFLVFSRFLFHSALLLRVFLHPSLYYACFPCLFLKVISLPPSDLIKLYCMLFLSLFLSHSWIFLNYFSGSALVFSRDFLSMCLYSYLGSDKTRKKPMELIKIHYSSNYSYLELLRRLGF